MRILLLSVFIAFQIPAVAQRGINLIDAPKFKIKKLSVIDIEGKMRWVHFYNEKGQILKTESGTGDLLSQYTYNEKGLLAETKTYSGTGSQQTLTKTEKNSYGANNRLMKLEVIDQGTTIETWKFEYDDKGNKKKVTKLGANGAIESITMFDYANGKQLIEERLSNQQGLLEKTTYKYDANGLLTEKKWVENKRPPKSESWKYIYDSTGKLIEEQCYYGKIDTGIYKYHYTSDGLLENWTMDGYGGQMKTVFKAEFY